MKIYFVAILALLAHPAQACVDISGKYLINKIFFIKYAQSGCESLTETWCSQDGTDCTLGPYSWTLDGAMVQVGGNPANWASIIPEGQTLHRSQLWDSGAQFNGHQCWWKEQWYSKDGAGNLKVRYQLECLQRNGSYKTEFLDQTWTLVP
jgi:hypothetical protein